MKAVVARFIGIIGLAVAASVGYTRANVVPWVPDLKAIEDQARLHGEIRATAGADLDTFLKLIDEGAIVIDTRSGEAFEEAHLAAPQTLVLNVPADEVEEHIPRLMEYFGYKFVLYCASEECDLAEEVHIAMVNAGFDPADLFIYFPGWEGILQAGLEATSGVDWSANEWEAE